MTAALVELTAVIAFANFTTRGNVALGIESDGFAAACGLKPLARATGVASACMTEDPFVAHRSLLFTVAYEMLGSAADAEDVVQETWLRWARSVDAERGEVRDPRGVPGADRDPLGLNRLRTLARRREEYVGEWLPEPLLTSPDVAEDVELAESVSIAMLTVLETLTPDGARGLRAARGLRRAVRRDRRGASDKSPAAVRQIAHRAREHVAARRPRMEVEPHRAAAGGRAVPRRGDRRRPAGAARRARARRAGRRRRRRPGPDDPEAGTRGREARPGDGPLRRGRARRQASSSTSTAPSRRASTPAARTTRPCRSSSRTAGSPGSTRSATRTSSSGWARWSSCDGESGPGEASPPS